jgi:hypothetical protein
METITKIIRWGLIPVSAAITGIGIYSQARDASTWGIAGWIWILIGYLLLVSVSLFIMIGFWKENRKIKKQLKQEIEQKTKREEIVALRNRLKDRMEIPGILLKMYERCITIAKENKGRGVTIDHETIEKINKNLINLGFIEKDSPFLQALNYMMSINNPIDISLDSPKMTEFNKHFFKYLVSWQGAMAKEGIGVMLLSKYDENYQKMLNKIQGLKVDLPETINKKIEGHIILINAIANLFYFGVDSSSIPPILPNINTFLPFLDSMCSSYAGDSSSEISKLLERFFTGEDIV